MFQGKTEGKTVIVIQLESLIVYTSFGGEGGIRTRGGMLSHTRFPGVRLKPLIHLSERARRINQNGVSGN